MNITVKSQFVMMFHGNSAWLRVSLPIRSLDINLVLASKMGLNFYSCGIKNLNREMYKMIHKKWLRIFLQFYTFPGLWLTCQRNPIIGFISDFSEGHFSQPRLSSSNERPLKFNEMVLISPAFSSIVSECLSARAYLFRERIPKEKK